MAHFEVPAKDIKRARTFYSQLFGWKTIDATMSSVDTYPSLVTTEMDENMGPKAPGAVNGGMMKLQSRTLGPSSSFR